MDEYTDMDAWLEWLLKIDAVEPELFEAANYDPTFNYFDLRWYGEDAESH
jgi:hypothetical protein